MLARVLARKVEAILATGYASILGAVSLFRTHLAHFVPSPPEEWAVLTTGAALAALLTVAFAYFWFRPKYKHIPDLGINQNIKTGDYFCSPCWVKDKLHSPLTNTDHGWKCRVCNKHFSDPSRPEQPLELWEPLDPTMGY